MQFKIGETVRFLDEVGQGIVLEINSKTLIVEDENGFQMEYPKSKIVATMNVSEESLFKTLKSESKIIPKSKKALNKTQKKGEIEWKLDLHMENLVDSHKNMSNFEILTVQMNHLKTFMKKAENAKIGKLVIVHGVGTGKLKSEIIQLIKGINGAEIFDASYSEYGLGASIIERKYNIR